MQMMKYGIIALTAMTADLQIAMASQQSDAAGFVEDSKLKVVNRNMYMNTDVRNGGSYKTVNGSRQGYGEEWGQGLIATYSSGFTQGTVGFGVDALGLFALKLDTGDGRNGVGVLERNDANEAKDTQSFAGGAVKMQISNTVLKYGDQFMTLPVMATSDSRLLPESAQGGLITSKEIKDLTLNAGHFTAFRARNASSHDSKNLPSIDLVGGSYKLTKEFSGSLYYADTENYFKKTYANLNYATALSDNQGLAIDFNIYDTRGDSDIASYDLLDNRAFSLAAAYSIGAHKFTIAQQTVTGSGGYKYGIDGNSTMVLANTVQISDFNQEDERSWQLRYDLNMAPYGFPGLSFMARYLRGDNFTVATGGEGKEWERDTEVRYVVQSGPAKDLGVRIRQATSRTSDIANGSMEDLRVIIEYPLSIL
jgi:imipenem/basic amino acid-specific outer membrane pore